MLSARAAMLVLGGLTALAGCGGSDRPPESQGDLWELRIPLAEPGGDARSATAVYQVLPGTPIEDVLLRVDDDTVGLTLRARIPKGAIIAIAWGFECVELSLPEPLRGRPLVDDSRRRYPGSESGIDDAAAKQAAEQILRGGRPCQRLAAEKVRAL
jgi:hypothetical protein